MLIFNGDHPNENILNSSPMTYPTAFYQITQVTTTAHCTQLETSCTVLPRHSAPDSAPGRWCCCGKDAFEFSGSVHLFSGIRSIRHSDISTLPCLITKNTPALAGYKLQNFPRLTNGHIHHFNRTATATWFVERHTVVAAHRLYARTHAHTHTPKYCVSLYAV
jgi:hypothetical protein